MQRRLAWKTWSALVALIPCLVPAWSSPAVADEPIFARPIAAKAVPLLRTQDVVLHPGNVLAGKVVDRNGDPIAEARVSVLVGKAEVTRGTTGPTGEFAIELPRSGVYWLSSGDSIAIARTWSPKASPPQATTHLVVAPAAAPTRIRGQSPDTPWYAGSGPLGLSTLGATAVAAAVATAIAVPIAVAQNEDDQSSGNQRPELRPATP